MTWIDTTIMTIIILLGAVLFYKALKEPFDLLFHWIGVGIGAIRDKFEDIGGEETEIIKYG